MPYRHPVAVTMSVVWWGIYSGCFGASIGALFGLWRKRTRIAASVARTLAAPDVERFGDAAAAEPTRAA
jgi:hypothetical protein